MERVYYFFKHNSILMQHSTPLILLLCLFWSAYDLITGDSMCFISTGAIWAIAAMSFFSVLALIGYKKTKQAFQDENTDISSRNKALKTCVILYLILFITLSAASAYICAANNHALELSGSSGTDQTVSLASALLIIPAIMPFPNLRVSAVFIASMFLSLAIPFFLPGSACYSFLPELVLRMAITVAYLVIAVRTNRSFELETRVQNGNTKLLDMMVNLIELRDTESGHHVNSVRDYTKLLLEKIASLYPEYGLTPHMIGVISEASATHDIGKLMIPDSILLKPGPLTAEEFKIMKTHTEKGRDILLSMPEEILGEEFIRYSTDICLYHHEKYDGAGYPAGLKGEDIPIWVQAVSIADCYEALTSKRHYKDACSHDTAVGMILQGNCGAFSPRMLESFLACSEDFRRTAENK